MFEQWTGHRVLSESVIRQYRRAGRPKFSSLPTCRCVEIRQERHFLKQFDSFLGASFRRALSVSVVFQGGTSQL